MSGPTSGTWGRSVVCRVHGHATLPVWRSRISTTLRPSSKPMWSSISLWRSPTGRRRPSWFAGRRLNNQTRCTSNYMRRITRISKTYVCIVINGVGETVKYPGLKVRGSWTATNARARLVSTGCIKVVCIVRRRRYSNAWTTRASLSTKRCGTTLIVRRSTSNAIPTRLIFHRTVIRGNGQHDTFRWAWPPTFRAKSRHCASSPMATPTSWWNPWWRI